MTSDCVTVYSRMLPSKGLHAVHDLVHDSDYVIRLSEATDANGIEVVSLTTETTAATSSASCCELRFRTAPEPIFQLDPECCGKNLHLLNCGKSVKNTVNKKWHTVRATVAFEEGVHEWHVRIDSCVSKNIFIGVCTSDASLENYIGSDAYGYGFLANKAIWHNKSKLVSYGEVFKQGDVIQVVLDCDARTLAFSRNGEFLGIAATSLCAGKSDSQIGGKWYPAISLYNKDDQVTLLPPQPPSPLSSTKRFNRAMSPSEILYAQGNLSLLLWRKR
ncbi:hypothetical protein PINS_up001627 [Pythium insidiosum]|nr:hypothetical protein PINS_up001627 [Pythium insidiosum]